MLHQFTFKYSLQALYLSTYFRLTLFTERLAPWFKLKANFKKEIKFN